MFVQVASAVQFVVFNKLKSLQRYPDAHERIIDFRYSIEDGGEPITTIILESVRLEVGSPHVIAFHKMQCTYNQT